MHDEPSGRQGRRGRRWRRRTAGVALFLAFYATVAYVLLPLVWARVERQPGLAGRTMITRTSAGLAGDPINIGLVGSRTDIIKAMHTAGWFPADPVTLRSSIAIVGSVLLDRPDPQAPVSPLFFEGRREDLAFEAPAGRSARQRHHVRFWQVLDAGLEGRPVWLGSATFDDGVGLSHYTGQVTHRIAPDVDAERERLCRALLDARMVLSAYYMPGEGPTLSGRNGGGDRYYTDGEIAILVIVKDGAPADGPPQILTGPGDAMRALVSRAIAAVGALGR